jgi:hypothetical protein
VALDLRGPKHGFSVDMLLDLLKAGLATTKRERMVAGGRQTDVARVRIREAGRQALARCPSDPDAEAVVLDLVQPLAAGGGAAAQTRMVSWPKFGRISVNLRDFSKG